MADFIPGLQLNAAFHAQVVAPLLEPWPHSAARLGFGSEVLGFDSERSTDHGWGPHLVVFAAEDEVHAVQEALEEALPQTFENWPVRYGWDETPVQHHVTVAALAPWLTVQLGVDPTVGLSSIDWLLLPQQALLEVTQGAVYRDDSGALGRVRVQLASYPEPVWLWMLACQWRRVSQEEAFVGRTAEAGDELGSRLVTARLVRELMRLWFLFARAYWPYTKWFGSAFARLPDSALLAQALDAALVAGDYPARETALVAAYETVAHRHNELGVTAVVDPGSRLYYGRPYRVLMAERFVTACIEEIEDPVLSCLPLLGSVDQVADSTDLLDDPARCRRLMTLYRPERAADGRAPPRR